MKCNICNKFGVDCDIVQSTDGWTTIAYREPFSDDDNNIHTHSLSVTSRSHWCRKNHFYESRVYDISCWCGWPINKEFHYRSYL